VLNALFNQLFQKASNTQYFDHYDRYMRLAFTAQAQCRATFETLALSKNSPVFARQANIAQGPQQINNTMSIARAGLSESAPNELWEAHIDRLERGAAVTAVAGDSAMAAVGTLDGTTNRTR
jgi:hypothetical protein